MSSSMFLNKIICSSLGINLESFIKKVNKGMRPVKAAISLGADSNLASIVAVLKLATTAEEINLAYSQEGARSCMTGELVGTFYASNKIQCIWSPNFRVLYNPTTKVACGSSYGFHRDILRPLLKKHLEMNSDSFLECQEELTYEMQLRHLRSNFKSYSLKSNIIIFDKLVINNAHLLQIPVKLQYRLHERLRIMRNKVTRLSKKFEGYHEVYEYISSKRYKIRLHVGTPYYKQASFRYVLESKKGIYSRRRQLNHVYNNCVYLDFEDESYFEPLPTNGLLNHDLLLEEKEEHILQDLGDAYRMPMRKPRTNYTGKYLPKMHKNLKMCA